MPATHHDWAAAIARSWFWRQRLVVCYQVASHGLISRHAVDVPRARATCCFMPTTSSSASTIFQSLAFRGVGSTTEMLRSTQCPPHVVSCMVAQKVSNHVSIALDKRKDHCDRSSIALLCCTCSRKGWHFEPVEQCTRELLVSFMSKS